ncbi:hypothetical protein AVEN_255365-1 [Araneus ventricosus]|uniref:Uncharacterized protein n=1 Tax=Araneus ventricosus TaxID=182803 RepID=A0A4Y2U5X8_ARAVE|nr:hypothetical protein AVEN_255365-1 [Araneus ventricosus]
MERTSPPLVRIGTGWSREPGIRREKIGQKAKSSAPLDPHSGILDRNLHPHRSLFGEGGCPRFLNSEGTTAKTQSHQSPSCYLFQSYIKMGRFPDDAGGLKHRLRLTLQRSKENGATSPRSPIQVSPPERTKCPTRPHRGEEKEKDDFSPQPGVASMPNEKGPETRHARS